MSTRPKRSFAERELAGTRDRNYDPAKKKAKTASKKCSTPVTATDMPFPKRSKRTGRLVFADAKDFYPSLTPQQVMERGAFGWTYWRQITSEVTSETYRAAWKEFEPWFGALNAKTHLVRPWKEYSKAVNEHGVKCGGTLQMWESSGWICELDPYGWFQWYCRFTAGRRCGDDARQIKRWRGVCSEKGRFRCVVRLRLPPRSRRSAALDVRTLASRTPALLLTRTYSVSPPSSCAPRAGTN